MSRISNSNLLYVRAYHLTEKQLAFVLDESLKLAAQKLGRPMKSEYIINRVVDHQGNYKNHCLVWVTNSEFFNLLIGKNTDGTERVIKRQISQSSNNQVYTQTPTKGKKMSWADIDDEEEKAKIAMSPKTVIEQLGPLFEIPVYQYTEDQLRLMNNFDSNENNDQNPKTPDVKDVKSPGGTVKTIKVVTYPTTGKLTFSPMLVEKQNGISPSEVKSKIPLPEWITVADLRAIFEPHYTGSRVSAMMLASNKNRQNGATVEKNPEIYISKQHFAFIKYKPGTTDGLFAAQFRKVVTFTNKQTKEKTAITFVSCRSDLPKKNNQ
jgi:hypothetical protein